MSVFQFLNIDVLPSGSQDWLFYERESDAHHTSYDWEKLFFNCIREGDVVLLDRIIQKTGESGLHVGKLSRDELRQAQYLSVAFITLATRTAIEAGMQEADAYNKSDLFIQKIDKVTSAKEIIDLTLRSMYEWTEAVHRIKFQGNYSAPIRSCVDYIYKNLHSKISLETLAKTACLSAPYLCKLFKSEVGINISDYILKQRIDSAKNMLKYSKISEKDIGNTLNFSSQSYFINCFKQETGITPRQYRRQNEK